MLKIHSEVRVHTIFLETLGHHVGILLNKNFLNLFFLSYPLHTNLKACYFNVLRIEFPITLLHQNRITLPNSIDLFVTQISQFCVSISQVTFVISIIRDCWYIIIRSNRLRDTKAHSNTRGGVEEGRVYSIREIHFSSSAAKQDGTLGCVVAKWLLYLMDMHWYQETYEYICWNSLALAKLVEEYCGLTLANVLLRQYHAHNRSVSMSLMFSHLHSLQNSRAGYVTSASQFRTPSRKVIILIWYVITIWRATFCTRWSGTRDGGSSTGTRPRRIPPSRYSHSQGLESR